MTDLEKSIEKTDLRKRDLIYVWFLYAFGLGIFIGFGIHNILGFKTDKKIIPIVKIKTTIKNGVIESDTTYIYKKQ